MTDEKLPILDYKRPGSLGNHSGFHLGWFAVGMVAVIPIYVVEMCILGLINLLVFGTAHAPSSELPYFFWPPPIVALSCCVLRRTRAFGLGMLTFGGWMFVGWFCSVIFFDKS